MIQEPNDNDLLVFRKYMFDEESADTDRQMKAAIDKLQTLYPGKHITVYDAFTLGIESDSLYSDTGIDTYSLGIIDEELPALRNERDGSTITFR